MTTYKGIKGLSIQTVAGDPSNLGAGDIWFDSVAKKIQGATLFFLCGRSYSKRVCSEKIFFHNFQIFKVYFPTIKLDRLSFHDNIIMRREL